MAGIFKAYDIRGIYGKDLTEDTAYRIGRAFVTFLGGCKKVVVGRDLRPHSEPLFQALARGLTEQGADVIDLGLTSTPMCYHANGKLNADGGIMITASHNPGEWNGFKLCRAQAVPISGSTGIADIEKVTTGNFAKPAAKPGKITTYDILPEYTAHVRTFSHIKGTVKIAVDYANAMGILEAKTLPKEIVIDPLFDTLDGTFPNHEANPLHHATLNALCERVRRSGYAFGVAFDGDADRAGFVDEKGEIVPMDLITALIAQDILSTKKGVIYYDLRSSWVVKEVIEAAGGTPMMSRVGHAFIKQQMREKNAVFAGELSGHYYFRDNYTTESSAMAVLCLANIVSRSGKNLSALIAPLRKYFASGEINSTVKGDPKKILATIKKDYADGRLLELDGVSVEYKDWWFNVRCSNTEPLVRLNLEAKTKALMESKRDELLAKINS